MNVADGRVAAIIASINVRYRNFLGSAFFKKEYIDIYRIWIFMYYLSL